MRDVPEHTVRTESGGTENGVRALKPKNFFLPLIDRAVITLTGADRVPFLQGMVSNDVRGISDGNRSVWAALLTAQGKYRHDFFLVDDGARILIDCEGGARMADLGVALRRHVLRADVQVGIAANLQVFAIWGPDCLSALGLPEETAIALRVDGGILFTDPRLAAMGARMMMPKETAAAHLEAAGIVPGDSAARESLRISLGLPDGSRDMQPGKSILLECGFDELGGVDWQKGCYLGQELTARTKYRGLIKKRLLPMRISGPPPAPDAPVTLNGRTVGEMRSVTGTMGLALMRVVALREAAADGSVFHAEDARLCPEIPGWMQLPGADRASSARGGKTGVRG